MSARQSKGYNNRNNNNENTQGQNKHHSNNEDNGEYHQNENRIIKNQTPGNEPQQKNRGYKHGQSESRQNQNNKPAPRGYKKRTTKQNQSQPNQQNQPQTRFSYRHVHPREGPVEEKREGEYKVRSRQKMLIAKNILKDLETQKANHPEQETFTVTLTAIGFAVNHALQIQQSFINTDSIVGESTLKLETIILKTRAEPLVEDLEPFEYDTVCGKVTITFNIKMDHQQEKSPVLTQLRKIHNETYPKQKRSYNTAKPKGQRSNYNNNNGNKRNYPRNNQNSRPQISKKDTKYVRRDNQQDQQQPTKGRRQYNVNNNKTDQSQQGNNETPNQQHNERGNRQR